MLEENSCTPNSYILHRSRVLWGNSQWEKKVHKGFSNIQVRIIKYNGFLSAISRANNKCGLSKCMHQNWVNTFMPTNWCPFFFSIEKNSSETYAIYAIFASLNVFIFVCIYIYCRHVGKCVLKGRFVSHTSTFYLWELH